MLFARNDVDFIHVPVESGGCLEGGHRRPVIQGARAKTWRISCPSCEPFMKERLGDLFVTNEADIPETPDEALNRESFEKRGAKDRDNVLALALASIANVQLPESLRRSISGFGTEIPAIAGMLVCANGHDAEPGSRFCPECGSPVRQPAATATCPQGHENAATAKFCSDCGSPMTSLSVAAISGPAASAQQDQSAVRKKPLKDWRADDLKALARQRGVDDSGTRVQVLERLKAAA